VTYDSGVWVDNSSGGVGRGRSVNYELSKWTKGNYNVNRPAMISSQISEHLSKPMAGGSYGTTSSVFGAFCDILRSVCAGV
jgi:hypothetical protein